MASEPPSWNTILLIISSNLIIKSRNFARLFHARFFTWGYIFRYVAFKMTEIFKMASGPPSWNTDVLNSSLKLLITYKKIGSSVPFKVFRCMIEFHYSSF